MPEPEEVRPDTWQDISYALLLAGACVLATWVVDVLPQAAEAYRVGYALTKQ